MAQQLLSKPPGKRLIFLVLTATAITGAIALYGINQYGLPSQSDTPQVEAPPPVKKVTALGRLEPEGEVVRLAAPMALDGDRVSQLLVKESDKVKAGQVVAILDSQKRLQDEVAQAKEEVRMAQAKLAQVKAGAKTGEIQAQQANISRLQAEQVTEIEAQKANIGRLAAELTNAKMEFQRHQKLYQEGAISASLEDSKRLAFQTAQEQLAEAQANLKRIQTSRQEELKAAKATLNQISEVRPVDVQAAQTEVDNATAALKQAQTNLEQAYIRAPMAGQIIKIHTRVGEKIADEGIADLGQTDQMAVVAEVYQTDIGKIQIGQQAVITGQAFSEEVRGSVSQIGLQVNRQNVFSNQPGENLDRRVVEVRIRLQPEDSKRVSGLTNLQVQTAIEL